MAGVIDGMAAAVGDVARLEVAAQAVAVALLAAAALVGQARRRITEGP